MKNKKTLITVVVLFIIAFIYTNITDVANKNEKFSAGENLCVSFMDVGQGDSSFIEFPNGKCMLIDASIKDAGENIEEYIKSRGFKKIDYVVATHPHSDHIGGMKYIAENFEIGEVYLTEAVTTTKIFIEFLETIKEKGITVNKAKKGQKFSQGDVLVEFLGPVSDTYEDLNNWSAVVKVTYKDTAFLFTGDVERLAEYELINSGQSLKADVLKVAHHGSDSSSSGKFLKAVNPSVCVISCGKNNDYGHPHKETLDRLKSVGTEIYRTDLNQTVVITSDGVEVNVL